MAPFLLLLGLALLVFPIWALFKILALDRSNEQLARRVQELEEEFQRTRVASPASTIPNETVRASTHPAPVAESVFESPPPTLVAPPAPTPPPLAAPPIALPTPAVARTEPVAAPQPVPIEAFPTPDTLPEPPPAPAWRTATARFDWEQFTGTKLLAWTGGAAAFLGAAFFIKYSFEHELISPAMRATIGYIFALALIGGGLRIPRQRYAVTAQTLCATGIVCLYAVTFACSSIYDFPFFTPLRTFPLMALITAGAFVLAVRLGAQVVAVLGMLGGFLTPVLLSTGKDNAVGLFSYVALLDIGLIALALHQRWLFLVPLSAAGTVTMQLAWGVKFLTPAKAPTAMVICIVFCLIFLAAHVVAQRRRQTAPQLLWPAVALPCVALVFALGFIAYPTIAARPGLLFSFILGADACLLTLAWLDRESSSVHLLGGFAVFVLLALWTSLQLTNALLPWALGLYLVHGAVHTSFPLLLERRRPGAGVTWPAQLFPPLALVLMLVPIFKLDIVSLALWPCVLLVDLLAIGLATLTGSILAVASALILTLVATAFWMFRLPVSATHETSLLAVIGGFAAVFFGAGAWLAQRTEPGPNTRYGDPRAQLPAVSALMPFLLLVMMTQRLPLANPSGVFALALLLVLLSFGLTRALLVAWLPACALAGVALLEYAWDSRHPTRSLAAPAFAWYVAFHAVFTLFPFVFRARFAAMTGPWAVAAVAGIIQFPLVYRIAQRTGPHDFMGVVPALFSIPPILSMVAIHQRPAADERAHLNQLAWFGGAALLFITLIVPIQFERQWITLGWALEGAALLWLFRRVPHQGLQATGVVLLVAGFVRLALNRAVLEYHARSPTPILNWYLYTYGLVIAALFVGAHFVRSREDRTFGIRILPLLYSLATILTFLLLNIEVADFFSVPGTRVLTFQFSGNFARDMTYTIAWAVFALALLLISIWKNTRAGRYAALALLGVAVLKLFVHDLARLGALYRIGALFAVAIVAIAASLAYQRFLPANNASPAKR